MLAKIWMVLILVTVHVSQLHQNKGVLHCFHTGEFYMEAHVVGKYVSMDVCAYILPAKRLKDLTVCVKMTGS